MGSAWAEQPSPIDVFTFCLVNSVLWYYGCTDLCFSRRRKSPASQDTNLSLRCIKQGRISIFLERGVALAACKGVEQFDKLQTDVVDCS